MVKLSLLLVITFLGLVGCKTGNCLEIERGKGEYGDHKPPPELIKPEAAKSTDAKKNKVPLVLVYKPDGSRQCESSQGISLNEMARELDGIKIYSKTRQSDGLVHIQACGSPTGMMNVYEIPEEFLNVAESRGFFLWDF